MDVDVTESASILFTDLVGATDLSQSLAPEDADRIRRAHFGTLRRAVASAEGQEIKNLGDGIMVAFRAASTAIACAVAMQQAVDLQNRCGGHSLRIRVGISLGEVTREGDDYFGAPVVEASRLCARAEGGQILATRLLQMSAGRRSVHGFTPLGELQLEGLPEPVAVVDIEWAPLADDPSGSREDGIALPRRLADRPDTGVIGRPEQLSALAEAYKRVANHKGREVVLISGEAGQGKTTLAAEAARRAQRDGAIVLLGRCDEELGAPYSPFAEALSHYISNAPDEVLAAHVAEHGAELARLTRALGSRIREIPKLKEVDAETGRYLLYAEVLGILASASENQPVLLLLDDLQWADMASLQLLRHLVKASDALRLLVVGTYRDTEVSSNHIFFETLATLRRERGVSRLALRGFDDQEVVAFLEARAGHELAIDGVVLAHAVHEETDGNPFFVSEMLRHLSEADTAASGGGNRVAKAPAPTMLPISLNEVVAARVARLGQDSMRVLGIAAVIGRDFELTHLSRVTGRDEDELIDLLDAAGAASVVREVPDRPGHYAFCHALVQHVLYQDLGSTRRARAHRRVAEVLEELCGIDPGPRVGELAHHWFHAMQVSDAERAVHYSHLAGLAALEALAPVDAVRFLLQALELLDQLRASDPTLEMDLLIDLGVAQRQAGMADFRETLLKAARRARALGDRDRLVRAALANSRGMYTALGVIDEDKVAVLESALLAAPEGDSRERALLLATLCSELSYGPLDPRRLALADQTLEMAERLADPATLVDVVSLGLPLSIPSMLEQRRLATGRTVAMARDLDDPGRLFWAVCFDRLNSLQAGDFERGRQQLDVMTKLSDELGQPVMLWVSAYHQASDALLLGNSAHAEELATRALELGTSSAQPDAFGFYGAQLMVTRYQQGRLAELASLISDVAQQNPGVAAYQAAVALGHTEAGNDAEALALLEKASADGFVGILRDVTQLDAVAIYVRVTTELGARGPAEPLLAFLAPYRDQLVFQGVSVHDPVSYYLGGLSAVLGRDEAAESYFAEALEMSMRGRMRFAQAQIQLAWGRILMARPAASQQHRARAFLEEARATASVHGYGAVERRALRALCALQHPQRHEDISGSQA